MNSKKTSKIEDHKIKNGVVVTPFNDALGEQLKQNSWSLERLPEYIWLALIHHNYGRKEGLNKAGCILYEISKSCNFLITPRLSSIFDLSQDLKKQIYKSITNYVDNEVLSPLTVLYRRKRHPLFNEFFYNPSFSVNYRIKILEKAVKKYYFHQSNVATDIRFLALSLQLFSGRIYLKKGLEVTEKALKEYPYTDHEDEKMKLYRPTIRSMEGGMSEENGKNKDFNNFFWKELGHMSSCQLKYIDFKEEKNKCDKLINNTREVLQYMVLKNKDKLLTNTKFEVVIGLVLYSFKIFKEVIENDLNHKILGRHAVRTIVEVYIMLKYLLKEEDKKEDIWNEYKYYGISKYKLILLKARENDSINEEKHHLAIPLIDSIVNEEKWEEYIDIDLRYFDQQSIRKKAEYVNEKTLYDIFYDYDTSYTHGFWGAIRESSMLLCDNAAHKYHNYPDIESKQKLPGIQNSCFMIIKKLMRTFFDIYEGPDWYQEKYLFRDDNNEKDD